MAIKNVRFVTVLLTASAFAMSGCDLVNNVGFSEVPQVVENPPSYDVSGGDNPSPGPGDNDTGPIVTPPVTDLEEGFLINEGAARTANAELDLKFITLNRNGMKISDNFLCQGGAWEAYVPSKKITTSQLNKQVQMSVQYRDWDNRIGPCHRQAIIHDSTGPDINFVKYPMATLEVGSRVELEFEVTDALSAVARVTCSLNGVEKPCLAGTNKISIGEAPVGIYNFSVRASDELGNNSEQGISWTVVSKTKQISQDVRVEQYKKVDILFVIDNSGSMSYEQKNMAQRTANFISVLRGLDYQIAITTTDPRSSAALGDGRFLELSGFRGKFIIDSSFTEVAAQTALSNTLQRPETGSGSEQGIYVTRRVIDRYVANESGARSFFRDGAQFGVVLISDEDESASAEKNDPENLIAAVHNVFSGQKMFSYHSIITKPGDVACKNGQGAAYGQRYKKISDLTGGLIGSVCEQDYAAQVTGIANGIRDLVKTITLQCQPIAGRPIEIQYNGAVVNPSYTVDGVNLKFASELNPGSYNVKYHCLNN